MRKNKAIKNILANLLYYCMNSILGLVGRKFFCDCLTADLVGLNGLLTSIISMLSLAELGLGTAIGYQLYRPLAEQDNKKVASIMKFFKKTYRILGSCIFAMGICMLPFLDLFLDNNEMSMSYIYTIYFIFLFDTVISYFFSYRRVLLSSDQSEFETKCIDIVVLIFSVAFQCLTLITTGSYILYLLVRIVCVLIGNIYTYIYVGKKYPFIKEKKIEKLGAEDKRLLVNDVKALSIIRIAIYCVSGTDNLLLSSFVGLQAVAIYSNYSLIILTVTNIFGNIFSSITANLGNFVITENKNNVYALYKKILFVNFVIATYMAVAMLTVFNYFIQVWVGEKYLWPIWIVAILVLNNYMSMIRKSTEAFRCAAGLFAPKPLLKYVVLFEGLINIFSSIFLVKVFGLGVSGIFLGTSISTLVSTVIVPWIVYSYLFNKKLKDYFKLFLQYFIVMLILSFISYYLMDVLKTGMQLFNVCSAIIISFITTFVGITILYGKSDEYIYWKDLLLSKICMERR